jgi:long-chain acyl-CoA synthetase
VIEQGAAAEDVMHFSSVCAMGDDLLAGSANAWREPASRLRADDIATIIYTSGTTGQPKGVMLSHGNLMSNITVLGEVLDFRADDTALSFLPLCHITQRLADYCYFSHGVHVVYVKIDDIAPALATVQPTTFPGVPRVFEKARDRILARVAGRPAPVRALLHWAIGVGREMGRCRIGAVAPTAWLRLRHALADRLALSRVRRGLGGRLRYTVSGGAPLNAEVMEFFLAMGLPILEGYGLTETTVLSINRPDRFRPGTVGPPLPGVELRMEADGEILVRGPGVARGYYLDVKRTEQSFVDGWFRTGDLGRLDEHGHLVITGRKKDILVTSGGKKVSPAMIEQSMLQENLVSQVVLVGDGRKYVSALLVPDRNRLLAWCRERGLAAETPENGVAFERLLENDEVRRIYQEIVERSNRPLARYEQIKKFSLLPKEFTLEGGELTPTLKIKRQVIEEKYRPVIESMYTEMKEA